MEGLKVDGRMKVKTLKADFKKTFGYALRVYNTQNHFVDDDDLLSAVRQDADASKSGEFSIDPEWTVDEFEKNFKENFGIKVQVYTQDESGLADNNLKIISGKSLKVDGRMKVKTVRENFKETYGFCLRVRTAFFSVSFSVSDKDTHVGFRAHSKLRIISFKIFNYIIKNHFAK